MNRKIVVSIVAVMLLVYGMQNTSYGQIQNNAPDLTPVSDRTPQVGDAIVAVVPGVDAAKDVTATHLSLIKALDLSGKNIATLKAGDFDGLSALTSLTLSRNQLTQLPVDIFSGLSSLEKLDLGGNRLRNRLPVDIFSDLSSLQWLNLSFNQLSSLPVGLFSGLSSLDLLNLSYNRLRNLSADLFSDLSSLNTLALSSNELQGLPSDVFSGVSSLRSLSLSRNALSGLPASIFSGLSSLRSLYLGDNTVEISVPVLLRQMTETEFRATVPTGAPFNIVLPINVANGSIDGETDTITVPAGSVESDPLTVTPAPAAVAPIALDIGTLPDLPRGHYGYHLREASPFGDDDNSLVFAVGVPIPSYEPIVNHAPVFTEGNSTMRSVEENTRSGVNIGSPVGATDADDDPLTYGLEGADAGSFGIVGSTGQLQTRAPLDFETQNTYAVTVIVTDGRGGADTIGVTISVTDVNEPPVFVEGARTTRSVGEHAPVGTNVGTPVSATDEDNDPLVYTLSGPDVGAFGIVATTGQLQTRTALDYETQDTYAVVVTVSDDEGETDTISVTVNVTDENDAPIFVEGENALRLVVENAPSGTNVDTPVSATDEDNDPLVYTLSGVDAATFRVIGSTGQLQTSTPLDYETRNSYAVTMTVSDDEGETDMIGVVIDVIDEEETPEKVPVPSVPPVEEDPPVETVPPVEDTPPVEEEPPVEELPTTEIPIDTVPIEEEPTNRPPTFPGARTTRSIVENTPAGVKIGQPVSATDEDSDATLRYTLGGTDAAAFRIVGSSGQLKTHAPLDYETKNAYVVTVTVSDGSLTDTIIVIITVIDVDETTFEGGRATRSIRENTPAGVNIGAPVSATNVDSEDVLIYSLEGPDAAVFTMIGTTGQLKTRAPLDYEKKNTYTLTVIVTDGLLTETITVTVMILDVDESAPPAPVEGEVTISEIMYSAEKSFPSSQWIELHNSSQETISLFGWTLEIENLNSPDVGGGLFGGGLFGGLGADEQEDTKENEVSHKTITFNDSFFGDVPTLYPNETVIIAAESDPHSRSLTEDQIYELHWEGGGLFGGFGGLWDTILSVEAFSIKLIDPDGTLVDEAGNFDGKERLWRFNLGHRGMTKEGHRSSVIRRYVDGVALDGTKKESWISAVDANLRPHQRTYYGDSDDISTPGIGIVANTVTVDVEKYDVNGDGAVNADDLEAVMIAARFGQAVPNRADVNGDGVIDAADVAEVAGVIGGQRGAAAPSLHATRLAGITAADIQAWLIEAQGLDLTDPKIQRGIRFLEQLLAVLIPKATELLPNYPNPFNPETWIPYRLAKDAFVTVTIYDPQGRVVRRLDVGHQTASAYEGRAKAIHWDGRNEVDDRVASGIYFYTLTAGDYVATRKMVILK